MRSVRNEGVREKRNNVKSLLPERIQRVAELVSEKGSSNLLTVIPLKYMDENSETQLDCGMTGLYPTTKHCVYVVRASQ